MISSHFIRVALLSVLTILAPAASAQSSVTNVIYINGIQNTLIDAQLTQLKIQSRLDSSPNHPLGDRKSVV